MPGKRVGRNRVSVRVDSDQTRRIGAVVGAPHTHLQSLGTEERIRRSGGRTGRVQANPFVDEALQSEVSVNIIEAALRKSMAKAIDDLAKKHSAATKSLTK